MANCNNLFSQFIENIDILDSKRQAMMKSRENLRAHIRSNFEKNHPGYKIKFYIQGSYKMGTSIRNEADECDLDDGVYISPKPLVTCATLQNWVFDAVDGITDETPIKKNKCIRVPYKADYHIDLPIYIKTDLQDKDEIPCLAIKSGDYAESDPKAVVDWFNEAKKANPQLVTLVKCLKAWGDHVKGSMPPGLAMTILVEKYQKKNDRDDIALRDTLKAIKSGLETKFECIVPAVPKDDMFEDYSDQKKQNILSYLESFIQDATAAINEPNELKASKLWRKYLGDRFPEGEDKENKKLADLNSLRDSILNKTAKVSTTGVLGTMASGVSGSVHTNYGD